MNPPFDRERDVDHVMHVLKFLKEDGALFGLRSSSAGNATGI
jgi:16S rRNA G1207 methylase RsmC